MKEVVRDGVLRRKLAERQLAGVEIAHCEAGGVAVGDELVHPAAIDLKLLLVVPVNEVARLFIGRDVLRGIEWRVGEVGRKARVNRLRTGVERLGQCHVWRAALVDLLRRGSGVGQAVHSRDVSEQAIETPVLLVDDDDMVDLAGGNVGMRRSHARASDER